LACGLSFGNKLQIQLTNVTKQKLLSGKTEKRVGLPHQGEQYNMYILGLRNIIGIDRALDF